MCWLGSSEGVNSKASLLKTRKESKGLKEIIACALQNGYSKIKKAQGERLCRSSVLETLPCNFIKTELHRWHFPRNVLTFFGQSIHKTPLSDWLERVFICLVSQIIIALAGQLSKCNRGSTAIAFRILVKSHKNLY